MLQAVGDAALSSETECGSSFMPETFGASIETGCATEIAGSWTNEIPQSLAMAATTGISASFVPEIAAAAEIDAGSDAEVATRAAMVASAQCEAATDAEVLALAVHGGLLATMSSETGISALGFRPVVSGFGTGVVVRSVYGSGVVLVGGEAQAHAAGQVFGTGTVVRVVFGTGVVMRGVDGVTLEMEELQCPA
jgi:hypothetical protein